MMRIAFVGLSTPIFYDYRSPATKLPSDLVSSPNPILDSPFGLLLLFDEIWFLSGSLCPENMRYLPYVKFLDQSGDLPKIDDLNFPDIRKSMDKMPLLKRTYRRFSDNLSATYREVLKRVGVCWDASPDNHTHMLRIGKIETYANSFNLDRLLFDMEVVRRLKRNDIELVTNSFSQIWLQDANNPILKAKLTELFVIENIPNYLTPKGPYHTCIEEVRKNPYLKDFRKWIETQSLSADDRELRDMKLQVETAIQQAQDEIFLKSLDTKSHYVSIGKSLVGNAVDIIVPGVSTVESVAEELYKFFDNRKRRWQGFIVSLRDFKKKTTHP